MAADIEPGVTRPTPIPVVVLLAMGAVGIGAGAAGYVMARGWHETMLAEPMNIRVALTTMAAFGIAGLGFVVGLVLLARSHALAGAWWLVVSLGFGVGLMIGSQSGGPPAAQDSTVGSEMPPQELSGEITLELGAPIDVTITGPISCLTGGTGAVIFIEGQEIGSVSGERLSVNIHLEDVANVPGLSIWHKPEDDPSAGATLRYYGLIPSARVTAADAMLTRVTVRYPVMQTDAVPLGGPGGPDEFPATVTWRCGP